MASPIDRLEEELFDACVTQVLAEDEATYERWEADEKAHLAERFIINPMPPPLQPLVDEALSQWETMEKAFLSGVHKNREGFLQDFDTARSAFLQNTEEWQLFAITVGDGARGMVRNMDCVSLFAWILSAADPANRAKRAATCKMVTAVFYAELLAKHLEDRILDDRQFLAFLTLCSVVDLPTDNVRGASGMLNLASVMSNVPHLWCPPNASSSLLPESIYPDLFWLDTIPETDQNVSQLFCVFFPCKSIQWMEKYCGILAGGFVRRSVCPKMAGVTTQS